MSLKANTILRVAVAVFVVVLAASQAFAQPAEISALTVSAAPNSNRDFGAVLDSGPLVAGADGAVEIPLRLEGVVRLRDARVRVRFDPGFVSFVDYRPGALVPGQTYRVGRDGTEGGAAAVELEIAATDRRRPVAGDGILGYLRFRLDAAAPAAGTAVSFTRIELASSVDDRSARDFAPGALSVQVVPGLEPLAPNSVFDVEVYRGHDRAVLRWKTRFAGADNSLRLRPEAAGAPWRTFAAVGGEATTEHQIEADSLLGATPYVYEIRSVDLEGRAAPVAAGRFVSRRFSDTRALAITHFDVQAARRVVSLRWETNHPADTRVELVPAAGGAPRRLALDAGGTTTHLARLDSLLPETPYLVRVESRRVGADGLVAGGILDPAAVAAGRARPVRTRGTSAPPRFARLPTAAVGPNAAVVVFAIDPASTAVVEYGPVAGSGRPSDLPDSLLYPFRQTGPDLLAAHHINLPDLQPATAYRYRVTAFTADGDSLTTDLRGNRQWSRDLRFKTSAAADRNAPVVVEGPQVVPLAGDLAEVRWNTDVETFGKVVFAPVGLLGTPDEFEAVDAAPDGTPRFARRHRIMLSGLQPATAYAYRLESRGANGVTGIFSPAAGAAKTAQPPGGAGSFSTRRRPDRRLPVIVNGPTLVARTHDSAVIEWATDEPADGEVRFSLGGAEGRVFTGANRTRHKVVLGNLEVNATYDYQIASTDASGNGATESPRFAFTTRPTIDLTPPRIVSGPEVAYKNDRSATIRWRTDEDASARVEFGADRGLGFVRNLLDTGTEHRVTLTNLSPGTEYFYRVYSTDLGNNGPVESALAAFRTDREPDAAPPAVSRVRSTAGHTSAIIRWRTDEIADSFVNYSRAGAGKAAADPEPDTVGDIADVSEHEIVLSNLEPGATYSFRVGSTDPADNPFSTSEVLTFSTSAAVDTTPPPAPSGLRALGGSDQARLAWRAVEAGDLAGYTVYRRAGSGEWTAIASGLSAPSYVDRGLRNGAVYSYRVAALDRSRPPNPSPFSETVSVTPAPSLSPSAPTALQLGGSDFRRPLLSFRDAVPARSGARLTYAVQVSTRGDFSDVTASVGDLEAGAGGAAPGRTAWHIGRDLDEGRRYFWRVRAMEGEEWGPFSPPFSFVARGTASEGDFSGDGHIDLVDFFLFVDHFGQPATGPLVAFDLDESGRVDIGDLGPLVDRFTVVSGGGKSAGYAQAARAVLSLRATAGPRADRVRLHIDAEGFEGVRAWGAVLAYDPALLRLTGRSEGAAPVHVLADYPGLAMLGGGPEPPASGALAALEFAVEGDLPATAVRVEQALVYAEGRVWRLPPAGAAGILPRAYALGFNYPNPFNPSTAIPYALPRAGAVELAVYDVLGQMVKRLLRAERHPAGFFTARWDGRIDGRPAGSGLYFYRLQTPGGVLTRKMTLVK